MTEKRTDLEWPWYCCECGIGPNSALVCEYCPSCQKHRCIQCTMQEPVPKRRQKQKKTAERSANKTGVPRYKTGATGSGTNAKPSQSPPGLEAQPGACSWSRSGTPSSTRASPSSTGDSPSSTRASSRSGDIAHQGGSGPIPKSDHSVNAPNGGLESAAATDSLSHATCVPGINGPTPPRMYPDEALQQDLPREAPLQGVSHGTSLPGLPLETLLSELSHETLPSSIDRTEQDTSTTKRSPYSSDSLPNTLTPLSGLQDYSSDPNGNSFDGFSSSSDFWGLGYDPRSISYDPQMSFFGNNIAPQPYEAQSVHEGSQTMPRPYNADSSDAVSQSSPENPAAQLHSPAAASRAPVNGPGLAKRPRAETRASSKLPVRRGLPHKRKISDTFDEGEEYDFDASDNSATPHQDKNLACPYYKMNPKMHKECGTRSIGNISALGQHLRKSHDLKLGPVPRKCKGQWETWRWYWKKLFPSLRPPASPYTDGLELVDQFALSVIQRVISPLDLDEPHKGELIRGLLKESKDWRADSSPPLDYSALSNHMRSHLPTNKPRQAYAHQR